MNVRARLPFAWSPVWTLLLGLSTGPALGQAPPEQPPAVAPAPAGEVPAGPAQPAASAADAAPMDVAPQRRLKFNFRFQRWVDVLEWFAEKADLSLVLDAPPPGTFNYSDSREYTPTEAIDLLNGVLATKGYALVRHDRMLTVVNLAGGIPENLIPRVNLEELDQRGNHEYVQVLFPLGERPAADVSAEIRPLLGKYGKSVPLTQTRQLMVTDTAGVMRTVGAVIQSIPEPKRDPTARRKETPEKPELVVYPLQTAEPAIALEVLKAMLPGATLALDSRAEQINVYATPSQQALTKGVLEQMQANVAGDKRPRLEVYRIPDGGAAELARSLAAVLPTAKLSTSSGGEQLMAFATPQEHGTIKLAIERLGGPTATAEGRRVDVYPLTRADASAVVTSLQTLFPRARLVADKPSRSVIALATPDEHLALASVLKQLEAESADSEQRRQLVVYPIHESRRKRIETVIDGAATELPDVKVVKDGEPGQLAVWARPADHFAVSELIDELQRETPNENKFQVAVFAIKTADPASILSVVQPLFPGTRFVLDAKGRRLLAWGSREDQAAVRSMLEQMDSGDDDGQNKLMVHPLNGVDATVALAALKGLAPDATLTSDAKAGTIVAWARQVDQTAIAAGLERLAAAPPTVSSQVYRLQRGDPTAAAKILPTLVPAAQIAIDAGNRSLVVSASTVDHARIKATIEQMDLAAPEGGQSKLAVYSLASADATAALAALKGLAPAAVLTSDAKTNSILAWATPAEQAMLSAAVEQLTSSPQALTPQVYRLQRGDPDAAAKALAALVPAARLSGDLGSRSLLVIATAADHAKIKGVVEQLDQASAAGFRVQPRTYPLAGVDGAALLGTLTALYATRPEVRFSLDSTNRKLLALATTEQHEAIRKIIEEAQLGAGLPATARLEVYPLEKADAATARAVLNKLVSSQSPPADVSVDAANKQVVVVAEPHQHEQIQAALERLQGSATSVEVMQLELLDPATAATAIGNLFGQTELGAPRVGSDAGTGQIFVRGTAEQIERIRELLVKMGETSLGKPDAAGAGRKLRMIPLPGDSQATLREIQQVWPRLRGNAIEVVTPSAIAPLLRRQAPQLPGAGRPVPPEPEPSPEQPQRESPPPAALQRQSGRRGPSSIRLASLTAEDEPAGVARVTEPATKPAPPDPQPPVAVNADVDKSADAHEADRGPDLPPILVAPGGDGLLIASEDAEALDQFEALVRALSRRVLGGGSSRDFLVLPLQIASATAVAESLDRLFRGLTGRFGASSVVVVPDARLNAVIVHASRSDRAAIERLVELLDSPNAPESLIANKPRILPVKNTKAAAIERVLRNVYQVQLVSGGGRSPVPVPAGISADMANVIRQVNAAVSGPQMTLSVDEVTNSLVIMAPSSLTMEVSRLVETLDSAAAEDSSQAVQIVPLRKTNVKTIEKALEALLRDAGRRRGREPRSP